MPASLCIQHTSCFFFHFEDQGQLPKSLNISFVAIVHLATWNTYRMSRPFTMIGKLEPLGISRLIHLLTLVILDLKQTQIISAFICFYCVDTRRTTVTTLWKLMKILINYEKTTMCPSAETLTSLKNYNIYYLLSCTDTVQNIEWLFSLFCSMWEQFRYTINNIFAFYNTFFLNNTK